MGLATASNLAREWRGTLLPAMVAHGINNGLVFLLLLFARAVDDSNETRAESACNLTETGIMAFIPSGGRVLPIPAEEPL